MSHGLHLLYSKTDEPWPYTIVLSGGYNGVKPTLHHLTWPEVVERLKACSLPEQAVASAHDHFDAGNDYYAGFTELNLTREQLAAIGIRSSER